MASPLRTLSHTKNLKGKRVLLRLDINSPLEISPRGTLRVTDDRRVREALPAIQRLQRAGAKIVVVAHLGEPEGTVVPELRLQPLVKDLRDQLMSSRHVIHSATHWNFERLRDEVSRIHPGDVFVLENVRFEKGEEENDSAFAKQLATLADLYVNEAFSVSHRRHASVVAITKFLPHLAGWRLAHEVTVLERLRHKTARPFVLVVGGAKVHDKIDMMVALAPHVSTILVGGIIANTILKLQGTPIGRSRTDERPPAQALRRLLKERRIVRGREIPLIQLPIDVAVARGLHASTFVVNFANEKVQASQTIYDIGPATIQSFATILKTAATIVWNGPMGLIEVPKYRHGSVALARVMAARSRGRAFGVVGGGESLEVVDQAGVANDFDFCSTGGGAMLEFLSGKKLPGIEALQS